MVFFFKPFGAFTDKYPAYFTIPFSFIFRAFTIFLFMFIDTPNSYYAYFVSVLLVLGTILENITIDGTFTKNLPKDVRGTLTAAYNFFGKVGILVFSRVAGYLFDYVGPKAPFLLVIILDVSFAILIIVLRLCKKFDH